MSIQFKIIMLECAGESPYPVLDETELASCAPSLAFAYQQAKDRLTEIIKSSLSSFPNMYQGSLL